MLSDFDVLQLSSRLHYIAHYMNTYKRHNVDVSTHFIKHTSFASRATNDNIISTN